MHLGYLERRLPAALADLADLAFDLRWNTSPAARAVWRRLDPEIWERTENPLLVLQSVEQDQLNAAAEDEELIRNLARWRRDVSDYQDCPKEYPNPESKGVLRGIAYFSMEFGVSDSLPIYSGGLGMLAGDHLKTASDMGVPMIGIGLLYQQGYFRQVIGDDGAQLEAYPFNDPGSLPIRPVTDSEGLWLRVQLPLPGRTLYVRVWEARIGCVRLFLLDSNDAMNKPWDRGITAQLYDAGRDKRLLQEVVLGVGGWHLIERLGTEIDVCHLNEGHAAFVILARAAGFAKRHKVPLNVAYTACRAGNVFTTHTPVGAAFDCYPPELIASYAAPFLEKAGVGVGEVLRLGRRNQTDEKEPFNMAWLALRGSCHVNAVSQLHGQVSRKLFDALFPRWPESEVPLQAITNGVHVPTWASARATDLWRAAEHPELWINDLSHLAQRIEETPANELWAFRTQQREDLIHYARATCTERLAGQQNGALSQQHRLLDPNVLTLGFARRFTAYKRANLLIEDPERLKRLLLDEHRPVQLIVAGKAHPSDEHGKALVKEMNRFLAEPELCGRVAFLDDYDMSVGQHLVAGVDVWLNTPLRPNEACGTSGMKVLVNGGINLSVLDGWWDEAFDQADSAVRPGWAIGSRETGSVDEMNVRDANSLFDLLENEVVPEFYDRDGKGIPQRWITRMKASMTCLTPRFSARRMMSEYVERAYLPAAEAYQRRCRDNAAIARDIRNWRERVELLWSHVHLGHVRWSEQNDQLTATAECWLDDVNPDAVRVQLYADPIDGESRPTVIDMRRCDELPGAVNGFRYCITVANVRGPKDYTVRVVPHHPEAFIPAENDCILWEH